MITIVDFKERINADGQPFNALILEGDVEMIQSSETGNFYATARRASITSTFTKHRCEQLIGSTMPGTIEKIECEPYEYTLPETGEIISLNHRYRYSPTKKKESVEDAVFERKNGAAIQAPV